MDEPAIAALSLRSELERFPFHAFVSKTITLAPRQGNPPPRLWEIAGGMINSIGLPNKGLEGFLAQVLQRRPHCGAGDLFCFPNGRAG